MVSRYRGCALGLVMSVYPLLYDLYELKSTLGVEGADMVTCQFGLVRLCGPFPEYDSGVCHNQISREQ